MNKEQRIVVSKLITKLNTIREEMESLLSDVTDEDDIPLLKDAIESTADTIDSLKGFMRTPDKD